MTLISYGGKGGKTTGGSVEPKDFDEEREGSRFDLLSDSGRKRELNAPHCLIFSKTFRKEGKASRLPPGQFVFLF